MSSDDNIMFYSDVLLYCKHSLNSKPNKLMEVKHQKKRALIESKNKLLIVLNETDLNQKYVFNNNYTIIYSYFVLSCLSF